MKTRPHITASTSALDGTGVIRRRGQDATPADQKRGAGGILLHALLQSTSPAWGGLKEKRNVQQQQREPERLPR